MHLHLWVSIGLLISPLVLSLPVDTWDEEDTYAEQTNPEFTDEGFRLIESDMVLPEETEDDAEDADRRYHFKHPWSLPVKFAIDPDQEPVRNSIMAGINQWREETCVTFEEVPADFSGESHLRFIKSRGCWSFVGDLNRVKGQSISIGPGCGPLAVVSHEIGHSMGFAHEQCRPDRDSVIEVLYDNIVKGRIPNFNKKMNTLTFGVAYDLTSNQHYAPWYARKAPNLRSMQTWDPVLQHLVGRRTKYFSHRDKAIFNAAYQCSAHCESPPVCQNEGFVNKDCVCVCPHDITGEFCENKPEDWAYYPKFCPTPPQNITEPGTIRSPNYPETLPTNSICYWRIFAPEGQHVQVTFTEISMNDYPNCSRDQMMIALGPDVREVTQFDCGTVRLNGVTVTSVENEMMLTFRTKGRSQRDRRFVAEVAFVPTA